MRHERAYFTVKEGLKLDSSTPYVAGIEAWRKQREQGLRSPGGWLSVVGMHWLEKPTVTCGSASDNDVQLVGAAVPAHALVLRRDGAKVVAEAVAGSDVQTRVGKLSRQEMRSDQSGKPDIFSIGTLSLELLERKERRALRVRDELAPRRVQFPGLQWFPVSAEWCKSARFVPHKDARRLPITDVTGDVYDLANPGRAELEVAGTAISLEAVRHPADAMQLFFIFKDPTNGSKSYGGGRYLFVPFQGDPSSLSELTLDFNKAITPPCGLTPYATCPMAPSDNVLPVPIDAGEMAPNA
ncbi:MAG: hypothetical protein RJA70_2242 [Pseudomonadota bacterium]